MIQTGLKADEAVGASVETGPGAPGRICY